MTVRKKTAWLRFSLIAISLLLACLLAFVAYLELQPEPPQEEPTEPTTEATTLPPPPPNVFDPADFVYDEQGYLTCTAGTY